MKKFLIYIISYFLLSSSLLANDDIFETNFHTIQISNEIISDAKTREIEKIKKKSLENILKSILSENNYNQFKRLTNINDNINQLIKNIQIEDEFISNSFYKARVKINFDNNEIISLLRNNKINYTDFKSPPILLIIVEKNLLSNLGLSHKNYLYNNLEFDRYKLISITKPDLSTNDRFILPYNKIMNKDLKSFSKISKKYNTLFVHLVILEKNLDIYNFKTSMYSLKKNKFFDFTNYSLNYNINYNDRIFNLLENWWKKYNFIDNNKLTKVFCFIKNSNIYELNYINSKIKLISQVKSNRLNKIKFGFNLNEIDYYGDFNYLYMKLLKNKIIINYNSNNNCIISVIN